MFFFIFNPFRSGRGEGDRESTVKGKKIISFKSRKRFGKFSFPELFP